MRQLKLEDFELTKGEAYSTPIYSYKLMVGQNEFRFRIIGDDSNYMAVVIYSLGDNFAKAKGRMEYSANGFKTKESAVKFLEQFISKMIRDGKSFIGLMRQYEIYD